MPTAAECSPPSSRHSIAFFAQVGRLRCHAMTTPRRSRSATLPRAIVPLCM
jgi:hypothetical protein